EVLEHQSRVQRRRSVVFLVSDFLDQGMTNASTDETANAPPLKVGTDGDRMVPGSGGAYSAPPVPGTVRSIPRTTGSKPWTEHLQDLSRRPDVVSVRSHDPLETRLPSPS